MANKSLDKRFRAAAVVQFIVLIGLMIYGIRSKRGDIQSHTVCRCFAT